MPRKFSYCRMVISEESENALRLIDFSNRPIDLLSSMHVWILNARKDKDEEQLVRIYQYLINYIITYPVAAACSLKVKSRGSKFVAEYVVPQLLMQWIRETDFFDGVRYKSSSYSSLVDGMGAINIALPVDHFRDDGLCEKLTSQIAISDIAYMDIDQEFNRYNDKLVQIEKLRDELWMEITSANIYPDYLWRLIELCDIVMKTFDALINGNYQNTDLMFNHIDCLSDYIHAVRMSKEFLAQNHLKRAEQERVDTTSIDTQAIITQVDKICTLLSDIVHKHTAFHFHFENLENFEKV